MPRNIDASMNGWLRTASGSLDVPMPSVELEDRNWQLHVMIGNNACVSTTIDEYLNKQV